MSNLRVINADTGEDLSQNYTLRHRHQDRAFIQRQQGRHADFTASNMRNLHEVYDVLTAAQCGYLMLLQCYVSYDGGTLVKSDKTPMTKRDMKTLLQLDKKPRTFYDFYKACVDNGIILENNGTYAVNERYHFKGAFDDQFVIKSYTTKIKRVYREVKATDIGLIYRMLPFVHMETNALCENPFEKDPTKISWFSRKELAEAIGVNADTIGRRLPKMTFDGEYVVARIRVGNEPERYTFNPRVFYRQNKAPDSTLQSLFNVIKR
ncbi:hypothetical protein [Heyndrickxia sporothermodurans]|uniref:hypothetical protein n=1 Tax=Heyndrickxia sporothermodurans TaxID=46224 RepID=UPI002E1D68A9|nr:hypothetical protein [Heyndrickxia sporothermodurans]MED3697950.1 hypothetical protein [Heyndrickxia sporothermodurans]